MWKHEIMGANGVNGDLKALLAKAQQFYLGDYFDYSKEIVKQRKQENRKFFIDQYGQFMRLPFPLVLFSCLMGTRAERQRISILCQEEPEREAIVMTVFCFHQKPIGQFSQLPGMITAYSNGKLKWLPFAGHSTTRAVIEECLFLSAEIVGIAISVLGARNVYVERVEHPNMDKRNRTRKRKQQPALERYHVLKFYPNKAANKRAHHLGAGENSGGMPINLCRGHFRDVSEDRPLFGRPGCHGRFWIQAHVKGKQENGIITKDYEITLHNRRTAND